MLKRFTMKKNIVFIFLFFWATTSCMNRIIPVSSKDIIVQEKYGVIRTEDYDLAIKYQRWNDTPGDLNDYFTTFFLIYRNKSGKNRKLNPESFALLDSQNEQYDLFTSDEVVKFMYGGHSDLQMEYIPSFPQERDEIEKTINKQIETRTQGIRNIKTKSFSFSSIRSQARKSGYIFFQKIKIGKGSTFKLFYNELEIQFQNRT